MMLDRPGDPQGAKASSPPVAGRTADARPAGIGLLRHWLERPGSARTGIVLMVASCGFLVVGDATAKWLTATYPVGQVIGLRGAIILALLLAMYGSTALRQLRPRDPVGQAWRALFFIASTFMMIWSFKLLPLPTVNAITFAAPLIMVALAPWVLGERVDRHRWGAAIVGFAGVLVIVRPPGGALEWVMLVPVGAAVCAAMRDLATRHLAGAESAASLVFIGAAATALAGAATILFGWVMPAPSDLPLFLLLGVAHGIAYFMQVAAFRAAESGLLAPFKYTLLIWSIVIAFLIWGHLPSTSMLFGAAIIIASGIYMWRYELKGGAAGA